MDNEKTTAHISWAYLNGLPLDRAKDMHYVVESGYREKRNHQCSVRSVNHRIGIWKGERIMREIKFRAWDKHAGKMIGWEIIFCFWNFRRLSEKWFIFMQYTGLKDKNGKEIYEGDIVKGFGDPQHKEYRTYNKIQTGVVKYGDTSFKIKNVDTECRGIDLFLGYELQVIGNIYENPELLEHPYPMIWNSETLDYSSY